MAKSLPPTFGQRLRAARDARGWALRELSERSGLTVQRISDYEQGRRNNPTLDTLLKLAMALGTSVDYLVR